MFKAQEAGLARSAKNSSDAYGYFDVTLDIFRLKQRPGQYKSRATNKVSTALIGMVLR